MTCVVSITIQKVSRCHRGWYSHRSQGIRLKCPGWIRVWMRELTTGTLLCQMEAGRNCMCKGRINIIKIMLAILLIMLVKVRDLCMGKMRIKERKQHILGVEVILLEVVGSRWWKEQRSTLMMCKTYFESNRCWWKWQIMDKVNCLKHN